MLRLCIQTCLLHHKQIKMIREYNSRQLKRKVRQSALLLYFFANHDDTDVTHFRLAENATVF